MSNKNKLHITQDDHGFWMMSLEQSDGSLTLLAHHFVKPDHLVEQAHEMAAELQMEAAGGARAAAEEPAVTGGQFEVVADALRKPAVASDPSQWPVDYQPPAPRKAGQ
jgi:hypothetical protein